MKLRKRASNLPYTTIRSFSKYYNLLLILVVFTTGTLRAQNKNLPPALSGVGLQEMLGDSLNLDLTFKDAYGNEVQLERYFDGKTPVILNFVYHDCPMLCSIVLESLTETLRSMPWTPGKQFKVLTISFSAIETPEMALTAKERIIRKLGRPEASEGWHFLTGGETSIVSLTESVGFTFKWIESAGEFAHPSALIFISGDGLITRYINGINYPAADVRRALVEASDGKVGSPLDQVLLYCFRYDPDSNSYVLHATNLMRIGGLFTLLVIAIGLFVFWRRERHTQKKKFSGA